MRASVLFFIAGCASAPFVPHAAPGRGLASITVTSPAFTDGGRIPIDHTCDGSDQIPPLVFSAPPDGTKSLVLVVDDPDADTFVHMIAFNVSPTLRKLAGGTELGPEVGDAARFGLNDFKVNGYRGPCPPRGEPHRFRFRVVALDTVLVISDGSPKNQVFEAIDQHIIGEGSLSGVASR